MRNTFLVCYDISNDLRLRRVQTMCGFGDRLQYSVFECQFSPTDLARCKHALDELIHHREDQVLFVDLGPVEGRGDRVITALGRAYSTLDSPCIIVDRESDAGEAAAPSAAWTPFSARENNGRSTGSRRRNERRTVAVPAGISQAPYSCEGDTPPAHFPAAISAGKDGQRVRLLPAAVLL